jgi:zinc transport system substrate-binding protein
MIIMILLKRGCAVVVLGPLVALSVVGCVGGPGVAPVSSSAPLSVSVAFYPFEFVVKAVGGDQVSVRNLTAPGVEPHDLELTPQQVASLSGADLVVYQKGFQPAVDAAVVQASPRQAVDTSSFLTLLTGAQEAAAEHESPGESQLEEGDTAKDPHTWLDPANMVTIAEHVRDALTRARPEAGATFSQNTQTLVSALGSLDADYRSGLSRCAITPFITSHAAFGYLAIRYGLQQIGIRGFEPDTEPSAARIAQVQQVARANQVTTIFFETLVSPVVSESVAQDLGLKTDVLDPIEGIGASSKGHDYLEVMRSNLTALQAANKCS